MKRNKILIYGIIAAGALYFLSRGKAANKLKIYFKNLTVGKIKGFNLPDIFANFTVVNPTGTALSVESIAGDIYLNNAMFTSFQNLNKIEIPANQEITYPIKLKIQTFNALKAVIDLIKSKQKIKLTFEGTVNSSGLLIPISDTIFQA